MHHVARLHRQLRSSVLAVTAHAQRCKPSRARYSRRCCGSRCARSACRMAQHRIVQLRATSAVLREGHSDEVLMQEGPQAYRLAEIVQRFGGELLGDPELLITQVATLERRGPRANLLFRQSHVIARQLEQTRADAVIVSPEVADATQRARIVCKDPYAYFARLSALLNPLPTVAARHTSFGVGRSFRAALPTHAAIGAFVSIGAQREVGARRP